MTQVWPSQRWQQMVLLGALCVLLQQIPVSYDFELAGSRVDASLVHLHAGLLLAVAMLNRDRIVVAGTFGIVWLGWCVRMWVMEGGPTPWLVWGLLNWLFAWLWAVACVHWAGWPRGSRLVRLRRNDLGKFAAFCLLLYPLGLAAVAGLTVLPFEPETVSGVALQTFFAKYFGIAVLTLPLVVAWSERSQPARPYATPYAWVWPVLILTGMSLFVLTGLWVRERFQGNAVLMDYRFVLFVVLAAFVLRLRPLYSMPLLSLSLFALAVLIADTATQAYTMVGGVNLLHIALEVSVLLLSMIYLWVSSRDRRELAVRLHEESLRDTVTGLPNLRAMRQRVGYMRQQGREGSLAYLMLDHTESLASGYGLDVQASVTRMIATQLSSMVEIYLVGTGQFALLTFEPVREGYWERLLTRVKNARIDTGTGNIRLLPYMGVSLTPIDSVTALDASLLTVSYLAFEARKHGELTPRYDDDGAPDLRVSQRERLHNAAAAFDSLRNERLSLHFQPIARISGEPANPSEIRGEILCRLRDAQGNLMGTSQFMPHIEAAGRGAELDLAVLNALFRTLRKYPKSLPYCAHLGINITGQSLGSASFQSQLLSLLAECPVPFAALCFEITETANIADMRAAGRLLEELRQMGCKIAIDDFGTGMQSFSRLKELPVDIIKIDGSFVRNIARKHSDYALTKASVGIAQAFGATTIAEFVEDGEIAGLLRQLGVDWGQGDYFGDPRPLEHVLLRVLPQPTPTRDS